MCQTDGAGTDLAEAAPGINALAVTVAEREADPIAANVFRRGYGQVLGNRSSIKHPLAGNLVHAARAHAFGPKVLDCEDACMAVIPGDS